MYTVTQPTTPQKLCLSVFLMKTTLFLIRKITLEGKKKIKFISRRIFGGDYIREYYTAVKNELPLLGTTVKSLFKRFYLFLEGREREGEKHQCGGDTLISC